MRGKSEEVPQTFLAIGIETTITCAVGRATASALEEPVPIGEWEFDDGDRLATVRTAIAEIGERLAARSDLVGHGIDVVSVASIGKLDASGARILKIARPGWQGGDYPLELWQEFKKAGGPLEQFASEGGERRARRLLLHNDATAAAYAEFRRGAGRDLKSNKDVSFVFIRVGEGVNAGLVVNLDVWRGGLHPEIGHVRPRRHPIDVRRGFEGVCPSHGSCYEGLISMAALANRWATSDIGSLGAKKQDMARDIVGFYVAQMCAVAALTLAPARIALGGATMDAALCQAVRQHYSSLIGSYPGIADFGEPLADYICEARSGRTANLLGALELARSEAFRGPRHAEPRTRVQVG